MLQPDLVVKEMAALQKHFKEKLDYVIERLQGMGFIFPVSASFLPYHTYTTPMKRLLKNPRGASVQARLNILRKSCYPGLCVYVLIMNIDPLFNRYGSSVKSPPNLISSCTNILIKVHFKVSHLPDPIRTGLGFFEACLQEKVIVVPGIFFDLNPSSRRDLFDSPCHHFVRVSYGPKWDILKRGLDGIERVLKT